MTTDRRSPGSGARAAGSRRKRDAVELVRTSGKPIAEVARELGIYDSTLGNWLLCRVRHYTQLPSVVAEAMLAQEARCWWVGKTVMSAPFTVNLRSVSRDDG